MVALFGTQRILRANYVQQTFRFFVIGDEFAVTYRPASIWMSVDVQAIKSLQGRGVQVGAPAYARTERPVVAANNSIHLKALTVGHLLSDKRISLSLAGLGASGSMRSSLP